MTLLPRRPSPRPTPESSPHLLARLDALQGRHEHALAVVEQALREHRGNQTLTDVLLDIRIALTTQEAVDRG